MIFRALDDATLVAGQIGVADIAEAAAMGVTTIVNNRPDGEDPGQPAGAAIEAAARAAGLAYRHLPVAGGIAPAQIEALCAILDEADGRLLLFCRSGTRSTYLWALAQSSRGVESKTIVAQAEAAGYDLGPLRSVIG
jgi:uncharacterized protein (TIGR01244 family)